MPAALVSLAGVAAFRGVHYDTVRKGWEAWVRDEGFPAPVQTRPYGWSPASLEAWAERREAANRTALLARLAAASASDAPANENTLTAPPAPPPVRRIDRERAAVAALMAGPQAAPRAIGQTTGACR